jgi:hypothetical protein
LFDAGIEHLERTSDVHLEDADRRHLLVLFLFDERVDSIVRLVAVVRGLLISTRPATQLDDVVSSGVSDTPTLRCRSAGLCRSFSYRSGES